LAAATRGVVALEFAIIAPALMAMGFGFFDIANGWIAWRHSTEVAQTIAEISTAYAVNPNGSNTLTQQQATVASTAIFAILPATQTMGSNLFGVVVSGVVFTPTANGCTTNCTYAANVAWSTVLQGSGTKRPCGKLTGVADSATPSPTTIPSDLFSATSLIVVDVTYTYQPVFAEYVTGNFTIARSAYLPPRAGTVAQWIRYSDPTGAATFCAGFS
jgi:Flp pilus assembly protein TadG